MSYEKLDEKHVCRCMFFSNHLKKIALFRNILLSLNSKYGFWKLLQKKLKKAIHSKKEMRQKYKIIKLSRFVMKRIHFMLLWSFMCVVIVQPMLS